MELLATISFTWWAHRYLGTRTGGAVLNTAETESNAVVLIKSFFI